MQTRLIWITPEAEKLVVYMARVSNKKSQESGENDARLLSYLVNNKHWSPFEMVHACFEIETTRDIARQILRHRSFSFQEFSQRYAAVEPPREARLQDQKNRQASREVEDAALHGWWEQKQKEVSEVSLSAYNEALEKGIAREQARAVLPEGLTPSRMYMAGSVRSWLHYCEVRTDAGTQKEHRLIATAIRQTLAQEMPVVFGHG